MKIGIDASRAFVSRRTGVEEYSYQVIKHLMDKLDGHRVFLYVRGGQFVEAKSALELNRPFPPNWKIKEIKFPYLWTQIGLSLEMLFRPVDILFVPSHVAPVIHPKNTIVTIHGLEYEKYPAGYSFWQKLYMRWSVRMSCRWATKIIAVSRSTQKDLVGLYKVPENKTEVIYEGVNENFQFPISNSQSNSNDKILNLKPYLLFIGRLEKRKNVEGIIDAYKILVEKYKIPHSLVLAGSPGYGFDVIKLKIENLKLKIIQLGYIDEATKWQLLSQADAFLFPTFYEGFGLPVLEAQSVGTPVVASNVSSLPEIAGDGAAYSVPSEPVLIAEAVRSALNDKDFRDGLIRKGYENVRRFSWSECASRITSIIKK